MKIIIILLTLCFSFSSVHADNLVHPDDLTICKSIEALAESIMRARQSGVSMSMLLELAHKDGVPIAEALIPIAFRKPRLRAKENQLRAIEDFKEEIFIMCLETKTEQRNR